MKRIYLIFLSLCILVIGISCASAADLNSYSVTDDIGGGDLSASANSHLETSINDRTLWDTQDNAPANSNLETSTKGRDLYETQDNASNVNSNLEVFDRPSKSSQPLPPQWLSSANVSPRPYDPVGSTLPPQWLSSANVSPRPYDPVGSTLPPQWLESGSGEKVSDSVLGSGLGGGGEEKYYATLNGDILGKYPKPLGSDTL